MEILQKISVISEKKLEEANEEVTK